ncbi:MAG TPA: FtsQ-type POTRA domain-containing protein [Actinomycetales bacterium]|nr:FtsQ-type POTRA domain-containing protein [Actinomycetales bacterium]
MSSTSSVQRFAARARAARWRSRRTKLLLAAVVAGLAGAAVFVWAGPLLVVRQVDVRGVSGDRAEQVRSALDAPVGQPLLQVDRSRLERRIQGLPFVASVEVSRGWPRSLVVTVDARTPRAAVPAPGGGYQLVDGTGVAYAHATAVPRGLPVVRLSGDAPQQPTVEAALEVLRDLPAPLASAVTKVTASSPDAVTLTIGKKTVVWGSAADTARKAEIFEALKSTKAKVYDVSSPDTPVLR